MSENIEYQYLFDILEPYKDEDGPWYVFFEREAVPDESDLVCSDTALFVKLPLEGMFWKSSVYSDDELHGIEPTDLFERNLATIMDDPSWRMAVDSASESPPSLQTEISDNLLDELPAHESHLLEAIESSVSTEHRLPEGLQTYLLELV